jgi:hypothetical protein
VTHWLAGGLYLSKRKKESKFDESGKEKRGRWKTGLLEGSVLQAAVLSELPLQSMKLTKRVKGSSLANRQGVEAERRDEVHIIRILS